MVWGLTGTLKEFPSIFLKGTSEHKKDWQLFGSKGKIELFGIYEPQQDKVYLIPIDEVSAERPVFRVEDPLHPNKNIKWAVNYILS